MSTKTFFRTFSKVNVITYHLTRNCEIRVTGSQSGTATSIARFVNASKNVAVYIFYHVTSPKKSASDHLPKSK